MSSLHQIIAEVKSMANKNSFRGNSRNPDDEVWKAIGYLATALEMIERQLNPENQREGKGVQQ